MQRLLTGCFLLALVNGPGTAEMQVFQKPRFYGVKSSRNVVIYCIVSERPVTVVTKWFRAKAHNEPRVPLKNDRVFETERTASQNASITIKRVEVADNGIYFCKFNNVWGPGTELQVHRSNNPVASAWRSKMKDAIIFIQGFLLTLFLALPLVRFYTLGQKKDVIYEEPELDHTYEGFEIDHCALYEDIPALSPIPEAAWNMEPQDQE